ncbi:unnamed protein product [Durusdinium trenchii]|uniref:Ion transport domain-containing protein n=1 Tax=Durusdinium trenchii TaxID=1381693 RepID=A0ABP0IRP5_9DINO
MDIEETLSLASKAFFEHLDMSNWVDGHAEEQLKRSSKVLRELAKILERDGQAPQKAWIDSRQAEICTAVTILIYAIFIGFELEIETNHPHAAPELSIAFLICHVIFNIVFVVELVLRLRSVGIRYCSPFNPVGFFDTLIILIGTGETVFSVSLAIMSETEGSGDGSSVLAIAGVMRILRLLRLARLLRGFLVCHELRLLVTGMMLALPTVVWAGVLFAIVVYLGTMFSVILLGNMEELHQYFGTFGLALWSHFVIVTMETWPDVADAVLEVASPLWGVYFVVFICVSSMSLMNLVTGVIAEKLLTTREDPLPEVQIDELEAFRKEKSALKADLKELFQEEEICADLFCGLLDSPKLRVWLNKLQVSAELPSNELFSLITSNNEALTLDGVVDGILSLRGSSVRVHSLLLQQDLRRYGREELGTLEELQHDVQQKTLEQLQCLQQSLAEELACISALVEHDATAEEGRPKRIKRDF